MKKIKKNKSYGAAGETPRQTASKSQPAGDAPPQRKVRNLESRLVNSDPDVPSATTGTPATCLSFMRLHLCQPFSVCFAMTFLNY